MKYVRLNNNVVVEIIPAIDPIFPDVPIEQRYPAEFVKKLVAVDDNVEVRVGMVYNAETGVFSVPEPVVAPSEPVPANLDAAKKQRIADSKTQLAEWLENHPMQYTDGKYYSVTEEKQSLLNNNLTSFERAEVAGVPYPLKWNASGEECVEWEYADLVTLSLAIAAYVAPKVAAQQAVEIAINACTTAEELANVVIDYDNA